MPIHTEPVDKAYVRIVDTYHNSKAYSYGILQAKVPKSEFSGLSANEEYFITQMYNGDNEIHPTWACTEITEKEYFLGVLKG